MDNESLMNAYLRAVDALVILAKEADRLAAQGYANSEQQRARDALTALGEDPNQIDEGKDW